MHVFMEDAELIDEAVLLRRHAAVEALSQPVEDRLQVGKRLGPGEQRQVPPDVMVDGDGIVELIGPLTENGLVPVKLAQDEIFVKIGDVGNFPAQRVDHR